MHLRSGLLTEPRWGAYSAPQTPSLPPPQEPLASCRPSASNFDPSGLRISPPRQIPGYAIGLHPSYTDVCACVCVLYSVPPVIDDKGVDTSPSVTVNDTSVLSCPVSGVPSPQVVWLRDGRLIDATLHPNIHLVAAGRQLRIDSAAVSDTAVYRCLATNKAGQDHLDYNLSVHSKSNTQRVTCPCLFSTIYLLTYSSIQATQYCQATVRYKITVRYKMSL